MDIKNDKDVVMYEVDVEMEIDNAINDEDSADNKGRITVDDEKEKVSDDDEKGKNKIEDFEDDDEKEEDSDDDEKEEDFEDDDEKEEDSDDDEKGKDEIEDDDFFSFLKKGSKSLEHNDHGDDKMEDFEGEHFDVLITNCHKHDDDKGHFTISKCVALKSDYFRTCLRTIPTKNSKKSMTIDHIPKTGIRNHILELIIDFLQYRAEHPELEEEMDRKAFAKDEEKPDFTYQLLDEWDKDFIQSKDIPTLMRIYLASMFLKIGSLEHVCIKGILKHIKDTHSKDIAEHFRIPADLPESEKEP